MRIAIFGTGGVGGRFGAQLASAGEDVAFIARGKHLKIIQTQNGVATAAHMILSAFNRVDQEINKIKKNEPIDLIPVGMQQTEMMQSRFPMTGERNV